MSRKIRYGMVGGGRGAFIGGVHRIAANMDGQIELVVVGHDVVQSPVCAVGGVVHQTRLIRGCIAAFVQPSDGKGQGL